MLIDMKDIKIRMKKIAEKYRLEMALLFGSVAVDKIHESSDIDIGVKIIGKPLDFNEFADLQYDLQRIFPEREVDLVLLNHADPLFLKKIVESPVLLFGSERQLAELKIYAFKRYVDHRRYFKIEKDYVDKFLTEKNESKTA